LPLTKPLTNKSEVIINHHAYSKDNQRAAMPFLLLPFLRLLSADRLEPFLPVVVDEDTLGST
jgi:hypothetical protein